MRFLFGYIVFYLPFLSYGQAVITSADYLSHTFKVKQFDAYKQKRDFMFDTSFELPLIEDVELRTETNDFRPKQQEYLFRISPNSLQSRNVQRKINAFNIRLNEVELELEQNTLLYTRYSKVVDVLMIQREIELKEQLRLVFEDKLRIMSILSNTSDFDLMDQIETEQAYFDVEYELGELRYRNQSMLNEIGVDLGTSFYVKLDTTDFISIENVKDILLDLGPGRGNYLPALEERRLKIQLIDQEYELERSEKRRWVDFFQAQYGYRNDDSFREELSLGIGLRLPFKGSDRLKMNELQLDRITAEQKEELTRIDIQRNIDRSLNQVELLLSQHSRILKQIDQNSENFKNGQFQRLSSENPLALLKLQRVRVKLQTTLHRIEHNILSEYLTLLNLNGKLIEKPLRNYLSNTLEYLQP